MKKSLFILTAVTTISLQSNLQAGAIEKIVNAFTKSSNETGKYLLENRETVAAATLVGTATLGGYVLLKRWQNNRPEALLAQAESLVSSKKDYLERNVECSENVSIKRKIEKDKTELPQSIDDIYKKHEYTQSRWPLLVAYKDIRSENDRHLLELNYSNSHTYSYNRRKSSFLSKEAFAKALSLRPNLGAKDLCQKVVKKTTDKKLIKKANELLVEIDALEQKQKAKLALQEQERERLLQELNNVRKNLQDLMLAITKDPRYQQQLRERNEQNQKDAKNRAEEKQVELLEKIAKKCDHPCRPWACEWCSTCQRWY